jgi:hypothetical protein
MPALVAGIHAFGAGNKTWMAGTSPAMTQDAQLLAAAILGFARCPNQRRRA